MTDKEYTIRQFERLGDTSKPYSISIQIVSSVGKTNFLNITEAELLKIKDILTERGFYETN